MFFGTPCTKACYISGGNGTVLQGNRFNITNGLKRNNLINNKKYTVGPLNSVGRRILNSSFDFQWSKVYETRPWCISKNIKNAEDRLLSSSYSTVLLVLLYSVFVNNTSLFHIQSMFAPPPPLLHLYSCQIQ